MGHLLLRDARASVRKRAEASSFALARIEPQKVSRGKARQDPKPDAVGMLALDAIALSAADGYGHVVLGLAVHRDAHLWVLQRALVPRARPVVGRYVQMITAWERRNHAVPCIADLVGRRNDDCGSVLWLDEPEKRLERGNDSDVREKYYGDRLHASIPRV